MSFDIKTALGSIAPTLATMLGGPLAGAAVAALEGAFGLKPGSGSDAITQVLQTGAMTPETVAAVRAADQKHAEVIAQQGIDVAKLNADFETSQQKIAADDRDSARKASVAGGTTKALFWMSVLLLGGALGSELTVLFRGYPPTVPEIVVGRVLGLMDAVAMTVLAYWYGTTHSSAQKTELLAGK